jgi:hypothetical protein
MKCQAVISALRCAGVTMAFAACGVLSARYFIRDFPSPLNGGNYLLGIPFALLCTTLFMRTRESIPAVFFMEATWIVAVYLAPWGVYLGGDLGAAWVGGLIGGLGVTLSASIVCGRLFSLRYLTAGTVIGWLSASSIGIWMRADSASMQPGPELMVDYHLYCAFGVWQAAMGTYLYAFNAHANDEKSMLADSAGALAGHWSFYKGFRVSAEGAWKKRTTWFLLAFGFLAVDAAIDELRQHNYVTAALAFVFFLFAMPGLCWNWIKPKN